MKLLEFRLSGFAQHHDTYLRFATGAPSLIIGPNESGKSHLLSALIGTLFGMTEADWKEHVPWEGDPSMCGELRFEADGQQITLLRRFSESLVEVTVDGNEVYRGRGLPTHKIAEDVLYHQMLARWLGFTEMEIFRNVVFVEQDQLLDGRLTKRAPEIKRLISGSREASYETALADLSTDLDKLKRLPKKRTDREIEELEKVYAELEQRVALAEQAESKAVDLLEAEHSVRSRLSEIEAQRSTLRTLLETYSRQHQLRTRVEQQTREYARASNALKLASRTTERRADLLAEAARLRVPGDPDPSEVRDAQFEQSSAIAACRTLDAEIEQNATRIRHLQQLAKPETPGRGSSRPRFKLLFAAALVVLLSLLIAVTIDLRALTGLPVAGMLLIAAFLFPKTVHPESTTDGGQVELRLAEQQRAELSEAMEQARRRLKVANSRTEGWLTAANEPTIDALLARLDLLRDTHVRLTETKDVDAIELARVQSEQSRLLDDVVITRREIERAEADHPELLDLTAEDVARHQQTILQFSAEEASLNGTLRENDVQRRVLGQLSGDDAAALRIEMGEIEAVIGRKRRLAAALEIAIETMTTCVRDFQEHALEPVGGEAGRLLHQITEGRHTAVELDQQSMEPTITTRGRTVGVDSLSRGTRDQLYLAIRVALVDALSGGLALPLIFDDPCVHFDAERLAATARLIQEIARERQVILLTKDESFTHWFDPVLRLKRVESVLPNGVPR